MTNNKFKNNKNINMTNANKPCISYILEKFRDTGSDYIKSLHLLTNIELDYEYFNRTYLYGNILNDDSIVAVSLAMYALELTDNAFKNKLVVCDEDAYDEVYTSIKEIYFEFLTCEYLLYTEFKSVA